MLEDELAKALEKEELYERTIAKAEQARDRAKQQASELLEKQRVLQSQYFTLEEQYAELHMQTESN